MSENEEQNVERMLAAVDRFQTSVEQLTVEVTGLRTLVGQNTITIRQLQQTIALMGVAGTGPTA